MHSVCSRLNGKRTFHDEELGTNPFEPQLDSRVMNTTDFHHPRHSCWSCQLSIIRLLYLSSLSFFSGGWRIGGCIAGGPFGGLPPWLCGEPRHRCQLWAIPAFRQFYHPFFLKSPSSSKAQSVMHICTISKLAREIPTDLVMPCYPNCNLQRRKIPLRIAPNPTEIHISNQQHGNEIISIYLIFSTYLRIFETEALGFFFNFH